MKGNVSNLESEIRKVVDYWLFLLIVKRKDYMYCCMIYVKVPLVNLKN